jgi:hypothetical protein
MPERDLSQDQERSRQLSPEQSRNLQQDQAKQAARLEAVKEALIDTQKRLKQAEQSLDRLQGQARDLRFDPGADPRRLADLKGGIAEQAQECQLLEARSANLERLERFYSTLGPAEGKDPRHLALAEAACRQIQEGKDLSDRWVASLEAQSQVFQKVALNDIKRALNGQDPEAVRDQAREVVDNFKDRGYATKEMYEVSAILDQDLDQDLDPASAQKQLSEKLAEFEKDGVMQMNNLGKDGRGLFLSDPEVEDLRKVWEMAQDRKRTSSPTNDRAVNKEWRKLLNPEAQIADLNAGQRQTIDAARKWLEDAGFSFEGCDPGTGPRLVSDRPLSRNDYTLSLQHEFPQKLIKLAEGRLDHDMTNAENLRLTTTRDNLQEDSIRFGKSRSFMGSAEERARECLEGLRGVLDQAREHLAAEEVRELRQELSERLGRPKDMERRVLEKDSLSDLRDEYLVEHRVLEELKHNRPTESSELGRHQRQVAEQHQHMEHARATYEVACERVNRELQDNMSAAIDNVRMALGLERLQEEWQRDLEDRIMKIKRELNMID